MKRIDPHIKQYLNGHNSIWLEGLSFNKKINGAD